jgi:phosphoglucosamine mutase
MRLTFGTDGVRGVANAELTPELAFALGRAGAIVLARSSDRHRPIVVGRDTRISGTMLEAAITAGITSVGRDVVSLGILPTPAVAAVTLRSGAAAGVVISASHNPIGDNGIKFFGPDGFKLSDAIEHEIESLVGSEDVPRPTGTEVGVGSIGQNLGRYYYEQLAAGAEDLTGLTVVVDGAFGAAYQYAPYALRKLGADVREINCEPDGSRINVRCGATDLRPLQERVRELIAAGERHVVGVAFDGDADRAMFVDETGAPLTGDHVMLVLGRDLLERGELRGNTVVATVMSNIGLEKALSASGITLLRAPVGDRYVLEKMREGGYVLGGEQSGHIIDLRSNTTGDGPMTAIALFSTAVRSNKTLHELAADLTVYPQVLVNVHTPHKHVLDDPEIKSAVREAERNLTGSGRLLIRPSGTEPLIRVMVEGEDLDHIEAMANGLAEQIRRAGGAVGGGGGNPGLG